MRVIGTIDEVDIVENDDKSVTYVSGATIDGDGANGQFGEPPCYAPAGYPGKTLDVLGNAGGPENWFGVVTNTGERDGQPIVQGAQDPKPGAFVSATSLHLPGKDGRKLPDSSPFKYVDSATVPYIAVPPLIILAVWPASFSASRRRDDTETARPWRPSWPQRTGRHLGEISVACARAIGVGAREGAAHPANEGGTEDRIISYRVFPGVAAVVNGVTYPLQHS